MSKIKTDVIVKENGQFFDVYFTSVPVFYAVVHEPKNKYQSEEREYKATIFIDNDTRKKALKAQINKKFLEVGVGEIEKGKNAGEKKYPTSDQVQKEGDMHYDDVKGLFGLNLAQGEFYKSGKKAFITVVGNDGKKFEENIGNMSICNIKCSGYRSKDGALNINLRMVKVLEHVPYEGKSSDGMVEDDIMGSYEVNYGDSSQPKAKTNVAEEEMAQDNHQADGFDNSGFDDSIPF